MVKAVDVEGLFERYAGEGSLEKADAVYLLYVATKEVAARTLRVRYGRSAAVNSVLEELEGIGVKDIDRSEWTEDTNEVLGEVVANAYRSFMLDLVKKSVREKAGGLSREARGLLYILRSVRPEYIDRDHLNMMYQLLFGRRLPDYELGKALNELVGCYVFRDSDLSFSPFFDELLGEFEGVLPRVEVSVSWPET